MQRLVDAGNKVVVHLAMEAQTLPNAIPQRHRRNPGQGKARRAWW